MLAELELPSGRVMLVEGEAPAGPQDVGLSPRLSLQEIRETVAEFADALVGPLRAMAADEVMLEFTLGVELATGRLVAFLAGGKVQSGMKVRVTWQRGE
jgi:hypothetical protein